MLISAVKQIEAGRTAIEIGREPGMSKHTVYTWKGKFVIATVRAAAMSFGRQGRTGCGGVLTIVVTAPTFTFSGDGGSVRWSGLQSLSYRG